jgi:hypothetical protein
MPRGNVNSTSRDMYSIHGGPSPVNIGDRLLEILRLPGQFG